MMNMTIKGLEPAEIEQVIKDIISGAVVAGASPNIGDWVEDLYLLVEALTDTELGESNA